MKTNLGEIRRNTKFTQEALAHKIGVCVGVVAKWEQGIQMPSYDNLAKLRIALNTTYDMLLNDDDEEVK